MAPVTFLFLIERIRSMSTTRRARRRQRKLSAINPLLKVLDRLEYGAVVDIVNKDYEGAQERLMTFVNKAAERVLGPVPGRLAQRLEQRGGVRNRWTS